MTHQRLSGTPKSSHSVSTFRTRTGLIQRHRSTAPETSLYVGRYNYGEEVAMSEWEPAQYRDYQWIVADPELLGGRLTLRGTRLSVSLILECLANQMTVDEINQAYYYALSQEALSEVLQIASELTGSFCVAA